MVQIDIDYHGKLKCTAKHEPSGTTLITVPPKDNMGDGSSFSATDLVATALGACIVTTMGIAAAKHGIELDGTTVQVQKIMSTTPPRRIAKLPVVVTINKVIAPEFRQRLEAAGLACPVHQTLSHDTEITIEFHWKD